MQINQIMWCALVLSLATAAAVTLSITWANILDQGDDDGEEDYDECKL